MSVTYKTKTDKRTFFDEAQELSDLIDKFGYTQEEVAEKIGRAQSTVANKLRLLRLSDKEREIILKYNLTERHARSLLKLNSPDDRIKVLEIICKSNLNVEDTEKYICKLIGKTTVKAYKKRKKSRENIAKLICMINRTIDSMKYSGVSAESEKIENEKYIEYRVKIPVVKQKA